MCSNVGSSTSSVVLRVGTAVVVVVVEHYGQGNSSRELSLSVAEEGRKKEGRGGWTRDVNHNKRVGGGQLKEEGDKEDWRLREKRMERSSCGKGEGRLFFRLSGTGVR